MCWRCRQTDRHVHFLEAGIESEIAFERDGRSLEVACVGREGFLGIPVLLGVQHSAHRVVMETDGAGLRIPTAHFIRVAPEMPSLVSLMLKFVHVSLVQIAANALADGRYTVDQRAARWMLMCHDRTDGDGLPLTHDSLSDMLGVRRSSITNAVHFIEGETAIRASRGIVTVRDRAKLEELAGGGNLDPSGSTRGSWDGQCPVSRDDGSRALCGPQPAFSPSVSAISAPRSPIGRGGPVVESRAV